MLHPTGLSRFARHFPDRVFDVGIAEQHAVTLAAGLARAGLHPVVVVYATFLNRAFDQVLMDCAMHRAGVTFVLDRAGVTGRRTLPQRHVGPVDGRIGAGTTARCRSMRRAAAPARRSARRPSKYLDDGPSVVRFSKDPLPAPLPAVRTDGSVDVLFEQGDPQVLRGRLGMQLAGVAVEVEAQRLAQQGIGVRVVDPVWALPVSADLIRLAGAHRLVITLEDGGLVGGPGSLLAQECRLAAE